MGKSIDIQERFLERQMREHRPMTVITTNGFQLKGRIVGFDQFTILLDGVQNLVFKSAVSTVKEAQA